VNNGPASNQPPPLEDYNLAAADPVLLAAVAREGGGWALEGLETMGQGWASAESYEWGRLANQYPPVLRTHDRFGNRADQVEFHPAWHQLLGRAVGQGLHSLPWEQPARPAAQVVRTASAFLASQIEAGHFCPISMTYAVLPVLRINDDLAAEWTPRIVSRNYDPSFRPPGEKTGVLLGMGMTEKQGGSDVRTNTTTARPGDGGYIINGHKWFTSAPMNDAFLVLAQAPGGLSCFLLPRFRPDGSVNGFHLQRLKDKLGNRSNASAEVEFHDAFAHLVGEEGRGVATIITMVNGTRLDCVTGAAALMRQAVSQAIHHCRYRSAFGAALIDQPAMANVLADLEIETEAAVLMMIRLAAAFDRAPGDEAEAAFARLAIPVTKYWVAKRCSEVVHEALECLGGNGFVEESIMPRLFRESPLNAIWEGSGNVIALDVLRAISREPETLALWREEVAIGGGDQLLDKAVQEVMAVATSLDDPPAQARWLTERLAVTLAASLLSRYGRPEVYQGYVRTRVGGEGGHLHGTLPTGLDFRRVIDPAVPQN
jgi:putative acyl-CoA dehydrogenase